MRRLVFPGLAVCLAALAGPTIAPAQDKVFRAGAAAVDIAPEHFPVIVNGGFLAAKATKLNDPIRAKCLVLDDGSTRLAIVVVDSCMMPRELLDRAKATRPREDRDSRRADADLGDAHPLGAVGDGGPGLPARLRTTSRPSRPGSPSRSSAPPRTSSRPASAGAPSTTPSTPSAGDGSAAPTRCSTIPSASGPSGPTCTPATRTPT